MKRADSICFDGIGNLTVSLSVSQAVYEHAHQIKQLVEG